MTSTRLNYINSVHGFTIYNETELSTIWNLDRLQAMDLRSNMAPNEEMEELEMDDVDVPRLKKEDVDTINSKVTSILVRWHNGPTNNYLCLSSLCQNG